MYTGIAPVAAGALAMTTIAANSQLSTPSAPPFEPAVKEHLTVIAARNMDGLLPTITTQNALTMIAPMDSNGIRDNNTSTSIVSGLR